MTKRERKYHNRKKLIVMVQFSFRSEYKDYEWSIIDTISIPPPCKLIDVPNLPEWK